MMHQARKSIRHKCPVCGSAELLHCVQASRKLPGKKPFHLAEEVPPLEWCEFQLLSAVHDLKQLDPEHVLVRAVEAALSPQLELPLVPPGNEGA